MKYIIVLLGLLLVVASGCQITEPLNNETNDSGFDGLGGIIISSNNSVMSEDQNTEMNGQNDGDDSTANEVQQPSDSADQISSAIPRKVIKEGESVQFKKGVAYDPDGDELQYTFSAPLNDDGFWQTQIGDAGEYIITISVSDGSLESTQQALLIVESVNAVPVISNFEDITVEEGDVISFNPEITDADGDEVELTYSGFMTSDTYATDFTDAGTYTVTLTADDGKQTTQKTVSVIVENVNRVPVLSGLSDLMVTEGERIDLDVTATDPDGDGVSVTYDKPFNEGGIWQTAVGDAGTYAIDVVASDGMDQVEETIRIIVDALNHAPTLDVPNRIIVDEGDIIEIEAIVDDEDQGDSLSVTYSGFMTSSTYQTTYDDAGTYTVTVGVTDGQETVRKTIEIVINDKNRPPTFTEGDLFE